jgi:hypothetical protein
MIGVAKDSFYGRWFRHVIDTPTGPRVRLGTIWSQILLIWTDIVYATVEFTPYTIPPPPRLVPELGSVFNIFTGFAHEYDPNFRPDPAKFGRILDHMLNVWLGGRRDQYDYMLRLMASMIQLPGARLCMGLLLISEYNTDEGGICEFLGRVVLGSRYFSQYDCDDQLCRFNSDTSETLLNVSGVTRWGKRQTDNWRDLVIRTYVPCRYKFGPAYDIDSHQLCILFARDEVKNIGRPVTWLLTAHGDNRYAAGGVDVELTRTYFAELAEQVADPDTGVHFFHYLAQLDLTNWDYEVVPRD